MSSSPTNPEIVLHPDPRRIVRVKDWLIRALSSRRPGQTERRIDTILDRAYGSVQYAESIYAAVQELRDSGELEADEAACLCGEVYQIRQDRFVEHDEEHARILREYGENPTNERGEVEALMAALQGRSDEIEAMYHEARGEMAWASMIRTGPAAFVELRASGECRLVHEYPGFEETPLGEPDPERAALIARRIMAMGACESLRAAFDADETLRHTLKTTTKASAVAAVRQLREVGAITRAEAASLLDDIVVREVRAVMESDRETMRLEAALEAARAAHGIERWPDAPDEELPGDVRVLKRQFDQRVHGIMATMLRRAGEHWLANLLLENPAEYYEMAQDGLYGGIGVEPDSRT